MGNEVRCEMVQDLTRVVSSCDGDRFISAGGNDQIYFSAAPGQPATTIKGRDIDTFFEQRGLKTGLAYNLDLFLEGGYFTRVQRFKDFLNGNDDSTTDPYPAVQEKCNSFDTSLCTFTTAEGLAKRLFPRSEAISLASGFVTMALEALGPYQKLPEGTN